MLKINYSFIVLSSVLLFSKSLFAGDLSCRNVNNDPMWGPIKSELTSELPTCRPKNVALTFDDGPSLDVTPKILDELKKRNIKATFFVTTTNIEGTSARAEGRRALVREEMSSGHLVADHGYDHDSYDMRIVDGRPEAGYTDREKTRQINLSVNLLNTATSGAFGRQQYRLFRFPYGRGAMPSPRELDAMASAGTITFTSRTYSDEYERNVDRLKQYRKQSRALAAISTAGFDHLGWNHDSEDFRYSVTTDDNESVRTFVKENLKRLCGSSDRTTVALYHDIKPINAKAIPLIVDIGRCMGLNFISPQEMMASRESLQNRGVLISRNLQMDAVADHLRNGDLNPPDPVGDLIRCPTCEVNGMPRVVPPKKTCISENGRTYRHCEGSDSICYDGEWFSRQTATENRMCNLQPAVQPMEPADHVDHRHPDEPAALTCRSSNGRVYNQCEGEDSICYNGAWSSRASIISRRVCSNVR